MIDVAGSRVTVRGAMNIGAAAALKEAGEAALAGGASVVDLAEVSEVDSSAVAVLLAWTRCARERNLELSIIGAPQSLRSLAALYGVGELLPLA
ncbi:MAG TPA: STAS domain-containing protein [Rhodocyclaceae bacterium]|nr:STAS domain-containing protein [Rhodocyclaceae bacterium]